MNERQPPSQARPAGCGRRGTGCRDNSKKQRFAVPGVPACAIVVASGRLAGSSLAGQSLDLVLTSMTRVYAAHTGGIAPARRPRNAGWVGHYGSLAGFPASDRHAEARKAAPKSRRPPGRIPPPKGQAQDNRISASPVPPPRCGSR